LKNIIDLKCVEKKKEEKKEIEEHE